MFSGKTTLLAFTTSLFFSFQSQAQDSTTKIDIPNQTAMEIDLDELKEDFNLAKGVRVSVVQALYDTKITAGETGNVNLGETKSNPGLGIGYAYIPVQDLGFTTRLAFNNFDNTDNVAGMTSTRLDLNAAFGFYNNSYVYAGAHLQKFDADDIEDRSPSTGFQAGGGYQFTEQFGVEVGYVIFEQRFVDASNNVDVEMNGVELAVHGTF